MPGSNPKKNLQEYVTKIESLILTGTFKPRERLVEAELAKRLRINRHTVRDVLKILESKNLVDIIPYKGAMVTDLDTKEIEDVFAIRVALERLAISLALKRITPEDIEKITKLSEEVEKEYKSGQVENMITANALFHDYIFSLCANPPLLQLINEHRNRLHILRYSAWSSPEILRKVLEEHKLIIKALQKKDLDALNELTELHISYSKDLYLTRLKATRALLNRA